MGDKIKEVTVSERHYQVRKMTPQTGSLIYGKLIGVSIKFVRDEKLQQQAADSQLAPTDLNEQAAGAVEMLWKVAPSVLEDKACRDIQNDALRVCFYYPSEATGVAAPVLMADGRFADKALEDDGPAMAELIEEAVKFSVAPFFLKGLAKASAPTSTSTAR